jgi:hypothetical protein
LIAFKDFLLHREFSLIDKVGVGPASGG